MFEAFEDMFHQVFVVRSAQLLAFDFWVIPALEVGLTAEFNLEPRVDCCLRTWEGFDPFVDEVSCCQDSGFKFKNKMILQTTVELGI